MMTTKIAGTILSVALALACPPAPAGAQTFRWVTSALPDGTSNTVYTTRLVTANANGNVTYSVSAGVLPPGLTLDSQTGILTGRPQVVGQYTLTFSATDASTAIGLGVTMKISASGGGGNEGMTFLGTPLPDGRVGVGYSHLLAVENGVGPYVYTADNLPTGLSLNGLSGLISGRPTAPGTYYVTLSCTDHGENENKVFTIFPLLVLPASSDFKFTTTLLDNGEVGTPYSHAVHTMGATGAVTYSAAGLPQGLAIDPDSGEIAGTPAASGTSLVTLGASDGADAIVANLFLWVLPSPTSDFYWDFFGFPAALLGVDYSRQPPITVAAIGGTSVAYTATGLPPGIIYDPASGELSGTAQEIGPYFATFTATDSLGDSDPANDEIIVLKADFAVLPPGGGSTNDLPANFWVKKQSVKTGSPGRDSWKATYIYNADRRTGSAFDSATDFLVVTLASREITLAPGTMTQRSGKLTFASPRGEIPAVKTTLDPAKQTLTISTKSDDIDASVPTVLRNTMLLGVKGYRLDEYFDAKGKFQVTSGYRKIAFVCDKAKLKIEEAGEDSVSLGLLLGDPGFTYESGVSELRLRVANAGVTVADKTFTTLVTASERVDSKTGAVTFKLKSLKDAATTDKLKKFSYDSRKGKAVFALANTTLALPAGEAHVTIELQVGSKTYSTGLTLFESKPGSYSTKP